MSMFMVTSGRDMDGTPHTFTVNADTFITDDHFTVFKVGNVVVKAVSTWTIESVEMINPPQSKSDDDNT